MFTKLLLYQMKVLVDTSDHLEKQPSWAYLQLSYPKVSKQVSNVYLIVSILKLLSLATQLLSSAVIVSCVAVTCALKVNVWSPSGTHSI